LSERADAEIMSTEMPEGGGDGADLVVGVNDITVLLVRNLALEFKSDAVEITELVDTRNMGGGGGGGRGATTFEEALDVLEC
jgi:hypothetical protein